jgi:surface antigen
MIAIVTCPILEERMVRRSRACAVAMVMLSTLAGVQAAQAQLWSPRMRQSGLAPGDITAADDAARSLYASGDAKVGQSRQWNNPATGSSGTVTLEREQQLQGMGCRTVRYDFRTAKAKGERSYTVNWCHAPDGAWRMVE